MQGGASVSFSPGTAPILHPTFNKTRNSLDRHKLPSSLSPGVSMHYTKGRRGATTSSIPIYTSFCSLEAETLLEEVSRQLLLCWGSTSSLWTWKQESVMPWKGFVFFYLPPAGVWKVTSVLVSASSFRYLVSPSWWGRSTSRSQYEVLSRCLCN